MFTLLHWITANFIQNHVQTNNNFLFIFNTFLIRKEINSVIFRYLCGPAVGALFGHLVQVFHVSPVQSQQSSQFGKQDGRTGSDTRAGPGYQGHLTLQGRHLKWTSSSSSSLLLKTSEQLFTHTQTATITDVTLRMKADVKNTMN